MAKILWAKALTDYLKDETLSYTSIASKYGVSLQAVKKRAGKEEWQNLRQKSIQKVKPVVDLSLIDDFPQRFTGMLQSLEFEEKQLFLRDVLSQVVVGDGRKFSVKGAIPLESEHKIMGSGLKVGIVGLPNVGKSTLFNALLKKQQAYVANFPFATIEPNVGIVPVPDPRLDELARVVVESENMTKLPPKVPATVEFVDIAGLIAGASKGEGLGNKFLSHIREVDAICHVVRVFTDPDIIREGSIDPKSDFEIVKTELDLADYEMEEKSKIKNQKDLKANLFSFKPILVVLNVDEQDLTSSLAIARKFVNEVVEQGVPLNSDQVVVISAKVEAELSVLSEEEQKLYLKDLGLEQSGLERLAKKAFATLGLITFLTAGEKEVRAWTIKCGVDALHAAGEIHTDFMAKFIKAEVVRYDDFVESGGWKKSREVGKARLEGRDYIVQDGDVIEFKIGS